MRRSRIEEFFDLPLLDNVRAPGIAITHRQIFAAKSLSSADFPPPSRAARARCPDGRCGFQARSSTRHRRARGSVPVQGSGVVAAAIFPSEHLVRLGAQFQLAQRAWACVLSVIGIRKLFKYRQRAKSDRLAPFLLRRLIGLLWPWLIAMNDTIVASPFAAAIDAAQALHHALPRHEIANHVIGIEIDADFARRCSDQECGLRR